MKVEVLEPHGFCAGVERALRLAASAEPPVCCIHGIVHNRRVTEELEAKGVRFVESPDEVPDVVEGTKPLVMFSAHGVSPSVRAEMVRRGFSTVDATCPFVERLHREARSLRERGAFAVIIGRRDHAEVRGTVGEFGDGGNFAVVCGEDEARALDIPVGSEVGVLVQTTFPAAAAERILAVLRERCGERMLPLAGGVCTAAADRQVAVERFVRRELAAGDASRVAVVAIGDAASSNTRRLAEVALAAGAGRAYRAGSVRELEELDFKGVEVVGLASGTSTPDSALVEARAFLVKYGQT